MYSPRSNFATEIIDDMLFAIGGFNGVTTIFNVECYDINADEWYDATDMSLYRSALSACVVRGLPNIQDYIYQPPQRESNSGQSSSTSPPLLSSPIPPSPSTPESPKLDDRFCSLQQVTRSVTLIDPYSGTSEERNHLSCRQQH
ncbi:uncharacterized protein LOC112565418 [Pomacea canaliculata]|nr:uncharacterized protein LOC112565418 [Pomacea canaliculata]